MRDVIDILYAPLQMFERVDIIEYTTVYVKETHTQTHTDTGIQHTHTQHNVSIA